MMGWWCLLLAWRHSWLGWNARYLWANSFYSLCLLIVEGELCEDWSAWGWEGEERWFRSPFSFCPQIEGLGEMTLLSKTRPIMELRSTRGGRNLAGTFKFWPFRYHESQFCTSQIWCKHLTFRTPNSVLLAVSFYSQGISSITTTSGGNSNPKHLIQKVILRQVNGIKLFAHPGHCWLLMPCATVCLLSRKEAREGQKQWRKPVTNRDFIPICWNQ